MDSLEISRMIHASMSLMPLGTSNSSLPATNVSIPTTTRTLSPLILFDCHELADTIRGTISSGESSDIAKFIEVTNTDGYEFVKLNENQLKILSKNSLDVFEELKALQRALPTLLSPLLFRNRPRPLIESGFPELAPAMLDIRSSDSECQRDRIDAFVDDRQGELNNINGSGPSALIEPRDQDEIEPFDFDEGRPEENASSVVHNEDSTHGGNIVDIQTTFEHLPFSSLPIHVGIRNESTGQTGSDDMVRPSGIASSDSAANADFEDLPSSMALVGDNTFKVSHWEGGGGHADIGAQNPQDSDDASGPALTIKDTDQSSFAIEVGGDDVKEEEDGLRLDAALYLETVPIPDSSSPKIFHPQPDTACGKQDSYGLHVASSALLQPVPVEGIGGRLRQPTDHRHDDSLALEKLSVPLNLDGKLHRSGDEARLFGESLIAGGAEDLEADDHRLSNSDMPDLVASFNIALHSDVPQISAGLDNEVGRCKIKHTPFNGVGSPGEMNSRNLSSFMTYLAGQIYQNGSQVDKSDRAGATGYRNDDGVLFQDDLSALNLLVGDHATFDFATHPSPSRSIKPSSDDEISGNRDDILMGIEGQSDDGGQAKFSGAEYTPFSEIVTTQLPALSSQDADEMAAGFPPSLNDPPMDNGVDVAETLAASSPSNTCNREENDRIIPLTFLVVLPHRIAVLSRHSGEDSTVAYSGLSPNAVQPMVMMASCWAPPCSLHEQLAQSDENNNTVSSLTLACNDRSPGQFSVRSIPPSTYFDSSSVTAASYSEEGIVPRLDNAYTFNDPPKADERSVYNHSQHMEMPPCGNAPNIMNVSEAINIPSSSSSYDQAQTSEGAQLKEGLTPWTAHAAPFNRIINTEPSPIRKEPESDFNDTPASETLSSLTGGCFTLTSAAHHEAPVAFGLSRIYSEFAHIPVIHSEVLGPWSDDLSALIASVDVAEDHSVSTSRALLLRLDAITENSPALSSTSAYDDVFGNDDSILSPSRSVTILPEGQPGLLTPVTVHEFIDPIELNGSIYLSPRSSLGLASHELSPKDDPIILLPCDAGPLMADIEIYCFGADIENIFTPSGFERSADSVLDTGSEVTADSHPYFSLNEPTMTESSHDLGIGMVPVIRLEASTAEERLNVDVPSDLIVSHETREKRHRNILPFRNILPQIPVTASDSPLFEDLSHYLSYDGPVFPCQGVDKVSHMPNQTYEDPSYVEQRTLWPRSDDSHTTFACNKKPKPCHRDKVLKRRQSGGMLYQVSGSSSKDSKAPLAMKPESTYAEAAVQTDLACQRVLSRIQTHDLHCIGTNDLSPVSGDQEEKPSYWRSPLQLLHTFLTRKEGRSEHETPSPISHQRPRIKVAREGIYPSFQGPMSALS
ncbi:hypothetical protein B0H34DRAFT_160556 [Crassisporium funariophilum]|nr:hypothetical protein B0H34DRAFT_160556 [Crassisporium funariophilum]